MKNTDIIRAWKDEDYRQSLSLEEQAQLPKNPAGLIELTDMDLANVAGGITIALCGPTDASCQNSVAYCPTGNCFTYQPSGNSCAG